MLLPLLLLCASLAADPAGEPVDVRFGAGSGAMMNWTTLSLEARSARHGSGVAGRQQSSEQMARQALGPSLQGGIVGVAATGTITVGDLHQQDDLGDRLRNRIKLWAVSEARYYSSGNVELLGELSVREYLKPWTLRRATKRPDTPAATQFTGVLLDARGTGLTPAFAPRIVSETGETLYDGTLWTDAALDAVPAVYVAEASHPAAARAGVNPLILKVPSAQGGDLVLDAQGVQSYTTHVRGSALPGEGRLVVLVDQ